MHQESYLNNFMDWVFTIRNPILTPLFQYVTFLGYSDFLFLFIPFCYWFCDREKYWVFPQFVFISALLNSFAKSFFQDPRPDEKYNIDPWLDIIDPSFGFPSGHAHLAVIIWGFIFLRSGSFNVKVISLFLLISISFSRIYLGVHDISDVIGGLIFGVVSLLFLEILLKNNIYFLKLSKIEYQGLAYIVLLTILLFTSPNEEISIVIGLGCLVIGFWLGQLIDQKYFKFNNSFSISFRLLSATAALIGFIMLDKIIEKLLNVIEINHQIEIMLSSSILGLYISFLSLFLLMNLRLQKKNK